MFQSIPSNLSSGAKKIRNNPQLIFTIVVAIVIIGSFVFMANRFIGIANDAEERLINVRVGSIQDSFVSFAADRFNDGEYLNGKIAEISSANETIKNFRVIKKGNITSDASSTPQNGYIIVASSDPKEVGSLYSAADFLYSLASGDQSHSITIEISNGNERLFNTARAIVDGSGNVLGVVMTTQTLSAADLVIQTNIRSSIYLLIAIVALILALFLRHSRIVDYMGLYHKLKEVDQLKDDFISMASHELRTPLTVIRGYAEYIHEAPDLSENTKDYAAKIDISAKSLDSLVSDILDVSRIQQGRMSFKMEKINPSAIIDGVVSSLALPAKEKNLEISFDKSKVEDGQLILADNDRLKQVLVNIVGNAVKYTPKGSVSVSQYVEGDLLHIRVSDTGIGLSAEEREKLFEKFYRVKSKETENIRGTGLGLWITAQIVKEMKGKITVESIKGVGTHFVISFPLSK